MNSPIISIVLPCYNEQEVLPETASQLLGLMDRMTAKGKISAQSKIWFVDDGSRDKTWSLIEQLSLEHPRIRGVKLSRNRGHQNALMAGLFSADGDALISIDADLQDDINAIEGMVDHFRDGADVVLGVRARRDTDTAFKRRSAELFYKLMRSLGADSVDNHADFRLLSRRAIQGLSQYRESNLFLRGIVPLLGFPTRIVTYDRNERFAGESKYPLKKMIAFALDGITSFSVTPLRLITLIGFVIFFFTVLVSIWALWAHFISNSTVPGWTSTVLPLYFVGGVQILCLGVVGEYLGKIYTEVKARPRFLIEKHAGMAERMPMVRTERLDEAA